MPCSWFHKRVKRYSHIVWRYRDTLLEGQNDCNMRLVSLLAACAPTTEVSLRVCDAHSTSNGESTVVTILTDTELST